MLEPGPEKALVNLTAGTPVQASWCHSTSWRRRYPEQYTDRARRRARG